MLKRVAWGCIFFAIAEMVTGDAGILEGLAAASEAPLSQPRFYPVDPNDQGASLQVYDAAYCDEVIANECPLVTFGCNDWGQFLVTIEDISSQDVARMLMREDEMSLRVAGKEISNSDNATSIEKNDMNGTWGVSFRVSGTDLPLTANEMVVETIAGTITVPLTVHDIADFERLISACE